MMHVNRKKVTHSWEKKKKKKRQQATYANSYYYHQFGSFIFYRDSWCLCVVCYTYHCSSFLCLMNKFHVKHNECCTYYHVESSLSPQATELDHSIFGFFLFFFFFVEKVDNSSNAFKMFNTLFFSHSFANRWHVHQWYLHVSFYYMHIHLNVMKIECIKIILIVLFATKNKSMHANGAQTMCEEKERMHCMNNKWFRVIQRSLTFITMNNFDAVLKKSIHRIVCNEKLWCKMIR